jgi:hypothetical protein
VVNSFTFDIKMNRRIKLNVKLYKISDKWYITLGDGLVSFVYSWFNIDENCMAFFLDVIAYSLNIAGSRVCRSMLWPLLCLCIEVSCLLFSGLVTVLRSSAFSVMLIV